MVQITLNLTEYGYKQYQTIADFQNLPVEDVFKDAAHQGVQSLLSRFPDVSQLSDEKLLEYAHSMMDEADKDRLLELSHQESLSQAEQQELEALRNMYQTGQYVKAEAMIEAQKRGLLKRG